MKRGMLSSCWVLLDADNPEGMPPEWAALTLAERLVRLEMVLPGISTCERVEYRGSSSRVVKDGAEPGEWTHALIQVSNPAKIEHLREHLKVATVLNELSFKSPRRSKEDRSKIVGYSHRTLIDLAVLVTGRIVFNAEPDVAWAAGYWVADAGIRIVNEGGGTLDISGIELPDPPARETFEKKTGTRIHYSTKGESLFTSVAGELTLETEIERRDETKPFREWVAGMKPGDKLRVETPFRASSSEAAFIGLHSGGDPFLFDVGTNTKYVLRVAAKDAFSDDLTEGDLEEGNKAAETARDPWSRLRAELHWSGADRALSSSSHIAWREPGIAMFGSESREGVPRDRGWITDRHARCYVSTTNSVPSVGKTFLSVSYANAIAAERPDLAGLDRIERPGAVVIIAADSEGAEEFQRKDAAFREYHGLTNADFKHPIFIFDAPGPFVEKQLDTGTWAPSKWIVEQAPKLAGMREEDKLALIVVDTLLGVSGGGNTSDVADMQAIVDVARMLATVLDCSVEIINHLTKGGAKADPTGMDAGLGARPLTATARFVANLTKADGVVTVTMAKESYMGGPRGTRCFEFKSVDVPVTIHDVDGNYVGTEPRPLGVLVPAQIAALERVMEDTALNALWEAHQKGLKIKRGNAKGPQKDDHSTLIVQKAMGLALGPQGRKKAEVLVDRLLRDARAKVVNAQDDQRNRFEQIVPQDPSDEL